MWDTAERYAHGESEATSGAWLASRPAELTGRIRIATKVAPASVEGMAGVAFDTDYVQRKLKATLDRVGLRRGGAGLRSIQLVHFGEDAADALAANRPGQQVVDAHAARSVFQVIPRMLSMASPTVSASMLSALPAGTLTGDRACPCLCRCSCRCTPVA